MTTKTNAVKKYRHCYEASEEGSWLVEVTENSHLSCSGKKDLGGEFSVGDNSPHNSDKKVGV